MIYLLTDTFEINRERAIDYLNTRDNVYVFDGYAGVCINYKQTTHIFSSEIR
jgi:phosphoenolpyruvate carboxykinase (ATP)